MFSTLVSVTVCVILSLHHSIQLVSSTDPTITNDEGHSWCAGAGETGKNANDDGNNDDHNAGSHDDDDYLSIDYIVIGAGAGGGVVASRLAEAGFKTLLLDAGPDYNTDKTQVPIFWPYSTIVPEVEWAFRTRNSPDPGRDNVLYPRASMIGGSTMHNAMLALYTYPDFWDNLRIVTGDEEFSEDKMRERFIRMESNEYRSKWSKGHGFDGYIHTSIPDLRLLFDFSFLDLQLIAILAAFALTNLPLNLVENFVFNLFSFPACLPFILDYNSPGFSGKEGAHIMPVAISKKKGFTRSSVYNIIKETASKTDKLIIKPNSFVTKILLSEGDGNPVAYGVEVQEGQALYGASTGTASFKAHRKYFYPKKEIILAGGSFNTPQTLMLSGIGPTSELEKFRIRTLVDLPGVGLNLRDKIEATMNFRATNKWKIFEQGCTFRLPTPEDDPCLSDYFSGEFPNLYTTSGNILSIQKKSDQSLDYPDLYLQLGVVEVRGYVDGWVPTIYEGEDILSINVNTPRFGPSTGTVKLKSSDPFEVVDIDFNGYDDEDMVRAARAVDDIRELARGLIKKGFLKEEVWPNPEVDTFEKTKAWVRAQAWGHHPIGTAKMGSDNDMMAVVNGQFQVRGVNNLRIVDASIFPDNPGFFPMIPIYMLAEKASEDIIKSDLSIGCYHH